MATNKHKGSAACRSRYLLKYYLKKHYGITPAIYEALLIKQHGACAICRKKNLGTRRLAVDHNHTTGKIRGLLCAKCNSGLGLFNDSVSLLISAMDYLEQWGR